MFYFFNLVDVPIQQELCRLSVQQGILEKFKKIPFTHRTFKKEETDMVMMKSQLFPTNLNHYKIPFGVDEFTRLRDPKGWLNDEVINLYMELLNHSLPNSGKVLCFATTFFPPLRKKDPKEVKKIVDKRNDINFKKWIFPFNILTNHFVLGVVDFRTKEIFLLDSIAKNKKTSQQSWESCLEVFFFFFLFFFKIKIND